MNQKMQLQAASSKLWTWWRKCCRAIWAFARQFKSNQSWLMSKIRKSTNSRMRMKTWESVCKYWRITLEKTATLKCRNSSVIRKCSSKELSSSRPQITTGCKVGKTPRRIFSLSSPPKSIMISSLSGQPWAIIMRKMWRVGSQPTWLISRVMGWWSSRIWFAFPRARRSAVVVKCRSRGRARTADHKLIRTTRNRRKVPDSK